MENVEQGSQTFAAECARARGEQEIPADEAAVSITGAYCDYSARGSCREHWFRMVRRGGEWRYFSDRLAPVGMRASERHQSTKGDIWAGEIVAAHDRRDHKRAGSRDLPAREARAGEVGAEDGARGRAGMRRCRFQARRIGERRARDDDEMGR